MIVHMKARCYEKLTSDNNIFHSFISFRLNWFDIHQALVRFSTPLKQIQALSLQHYSDVLNLAWSPTALAFSSQLTDIVKDRLRLTTIQRVSPERLGYLNCKNVTLSQLLHITFHNSSSGNVKVLESNKIKLQQTVYICLCVLCVWDREGGKASTLFSALSGCLDTSTERLACVLHREPIYHFTKRGLVCVCGFSVSVCLFLCDSMCFCSVMFSKTLSMLCVCVRERRRGVSAFQ